MATRAIIRAMDSEVADDGHLRTFPRLTVYHHYDGYPGWLGFVLAEGLAQHGKAGASLFLVRMLDVLAGDEAGKSNVYIESNETIDMGQEYEYILHCPGWTNGDALDWAIEIKERKGWGDDERWNTIFAGDITEFHEYCKAAAESIAEALQ